MNSYLRKKGVFFKNLFTEPLQSLKLNQKDDVSYVHNVNSNYEPFFFYLLLYKLPKKYTNIPGVAKFRLTSNRKPCSLIKNLKNYKFEEV